MKNAVISVLLLAAAEAGAALTNTNFVVKAKALAVATNGAIVAPVSAAAFRAANDIASATNAAGVIVPYTNLLSNLSAGDGSGLTNTSDHVARTNASAAYALAAAAAGETGTAAYALAASARGTGTAAYAQAMIAQATGTAAYALATSALSTGVAAHTLAEAALPKTGGILNGNLELSDTNYLFANSIYGSVYLGVAAPFYSAVGGILQFSIGSATNALIMGGDGFYRMDGNDAYQIYDAGNAASATGTVAYAQAMIAQATGTAAYALATSALSTGVAAHTLAGAALPKTGGILNGNLELSDTNYLFANSIYGSVYLGVAAPLYSAVGGILQFSIGSATNALIMGGDGFYRIDGNDAYQIYDAGNAVSILTVSSAQTNYWRQTGTAPTGSTAVGLSHQINVSAINATSVWVSIYWGRSNRWYRAQFNGF